MLMKFEIFFISIANINLLIKTCVVTKKKVEVHAELTSFVVRVEIFLQQNTSSIL